MVNSGGVFDVSLKELVGGKSSRALEKSFGMATAGDLFHHFPRRYAERGQLTPFSEIEVGQPVTIMATISSVTSRHMKSKKGSLLVVTVTDGSDTMDLTFFNQKWRDRELVVGRSGLFAGTVSEYHGALNLTHPQYQLFGDGEDTHADSISEFAGSIIPVYPSSQSITSWQISSAVNVVLASLDEVFDPVPPALAQKHQLMSRKEAMKAIHQPASVEEIERAQYRLKYEEAFALQVLLEQRRVERRSLNATSRRSMEHALVKEFDSTLPFDLTAGQIDVGEEISEDLGSDSPMMRLLQGDVGSGKTIIALRAMLDVIECGGQAALLAPTEVLATQHWETIQSLLGRMQGDSEIEVTLLTGSLPSTTRKRALLDIASGMSNIVVGTHALLQEKVDFFDLGLVVVDEQHRFGVEQRAALVAKGRQGIRPHLLVMTATPIPRTTALTVFGDLDISTLSESPSMRAPVETFVVDPATHPSHESRVWERMAEEARAGNRVFVVCPSIAPGQSESDVLESDHSAEHQITDWSSISSVEQTFTELTERFPDIACGVLHGRMTSEEKNAVMDRFREGHSDPIQVLVATTVIEVGVDVPAATMMVIRNAERFGISQLHQLRGRIGRGDKPGLCLLIQGAHATDSARQRLAAVAGTRDGFELAHLDLEIRREGDVLGQRQSGGLTSLRLLRVIEDIELIEEVRTEVADLSQHADWAETVLAIEKMNLNRVAQLEKT